MDGLEFMGAWSFAMPDKRAILELVRSHDTCWLETPKCPEMRHCRSGKCPSALGCLKALQILQFRRNTIAFVGELMRAPLPGQAVTEWLGRVETMQRRVEAFIIGVLEVESWDDAMAVIKKEDNEIQEAIREGWESAEARVALSWFMNPDVQMPVVTTAGGSSDTVHEEGRG